MLHYWDNHTRAYTREEVEAHPNAYYHEKGCLLRVGPRGGTEVRCFAYRPSGKLQVWKKDVSRYRLPLKHGMYGPSFELVRDGTFLHREDECRAILGAEIVAVARNTTGGTLSRRLAGVRSGLEAFMAGR